MRPHRSFSWLYVCVVAAIYVLLSPVSANAEGNVTVSVSRSLVLVRILWQGTVRVTGASGIIRGGEASTVAICTGWFVSRDGYIVTAGHCVDEAIARQDLISSFTRMNPSTEDTPAKGAGTTDASVSNMSLGVTVEQVGSDPSRTLQQAVPARLVSRQEFDAGDLALLQVPLVSNVQVLGIAKDRPAVGTDVYAIGYPSGLLQADFSNAQLEPHTSTGTVTSLQNFRGNAVIGISSPLIGGMSGGPVVNEHGEVVGISSFEAGEMYFATDTASLQDFLRVNGIEPHLAGSAAPSGRGIRHSVTIVSLLTGAMFFVLLTVLLYMQNKRLRREVASLLIQRNTTVMNSEIPAIRS